MGFLSWLLMGAGVGAVVRWALPTRCGSWPLTISLGAAGGFVGAFIGQVLGIGHLSSFSIPSLWLAVAGALAVLYIASHLLP
ncbi:GlsB/YeaQ/YmgE family stress response membrane protein [Ferrimonas marina]|uniref:Transglycosylase associated protein n=1 Tax=Ferrimonas marina TaxID=299255 RepID=A0A1M5P251_9GAMM|nr:hypothetical protein [Ferrimonas marina]SHG95881.1 hypothetical protein SAMN02745129_1262 [Ferrimonas marina]